jgi:hypothetical protein
MTRSIEPKYSSKRGCIYCCLDSPEAVHPPAEQPRHEAPTIDISLLLLLSLMFLIMAALLLLHVALSLG